MTAKTLSNRIEAIGKAHGMDVTALAAKSGSVWTTPDWTDWPDAMLAEVMSIGTRRAGPQGDYWVPTEADDAE